MTLPFATRFTRRLAVAGLFALLLLAPAVADDEPRGRLLFLGVAYDEAPPAGHGPGHYDYAPDNFVRLLKTQSTALFSEVDIVTLKGAGATRERVAGALQSLQRTARPDDLVMLYWGTHGGVGRKGWGANLPGGEVHGGEFKQSLAKIGCPVVCIISTCGSGGFPRSVYDGVELPENVTVFCACLGRQSTSNEMDRAMCEALAGFADSDGNGEVTLGEAYEYVPLRYRHMLRGTPSDDMLPVLQKSGASPLDRVLTRVDNSHAAVVHDGDWYGVTVLERNGDEAKVRFLGFDSTTANGGFSIPDATYSGESIDFPGGPPPIEVEWEGDWYPAAIRQRSPTPRQLDIHYIGYPETDDETVPRSRVRFPFGGVERRKPPGLGRITHPPLPESGPPRRGPR